MYAVEGTPEEQSPRETLRPTYRTGEATLESGARPGVRTEGGSRVRSGRGETLRSDDRAGETSETHRVGAVHRRSLHARAVVP